MADGHDSSGNGERLGRECALRLLKLMDAGLDGVKTLLALLVIFLHGLEERLIFLGQPFLLGGGFLGQGQMFGEAPFKVRAGLVIEFRLNLDPFPALGAPRFGFGLEFLLRKAVEQRRVEQENPVIAFGEEVTRDRAACFLVGGNRDEPGALVGGGNLAFREGAADVIRVVAPRLKIA